MELKKEPRIGSSQMVRSHFQFWIDSFSQCGFVGFRMESF